VGSIPDYETPRPQTAISKSGVTMPRHAAVCAGDQANQALGPRRAPRPGTRGVLQPIAAGTLRDLNGMPAPVACTSEPLVVCHAASVKDRGKGERQERAWLARPPRRVWIVLEAGQRERNAPVGFGDRRDPGASIQGHLTVQRTALVQHLKRIERRRRLARLAAQIGLQRTTARSSRSNPERSPATSRQSTGPGQHSGKPTGNAG